MNKTIKKLTKFAMASLTAASILTSSVFADDLGSITYAAAADMDSSLTDFQDDYVNEISQSDEISPRVMIYTVSFNANGGTGAPNSQNKAEGYPIYIRAEVPTRSGYIFCGWAESRYASSPTYHPHDEYTANKSCTLYAVWKSFPYSDGSYYNETFWYPYAGGTSGELTSSCTECKAFARYTYYTVNNYYVPHPDFFDKVPITLDTSNLYTYLKKMGAGSYVRGKTQSGINHSVYIVTYDMDTVTMYDANFTSKTVAYKELTYAEFLNRIKTLDYYFSRQ